MGKDLFLNKHVKGALPALIPSDSLLELVGLIYEGVNEPTPWHSLTLRLRELLSAKAVSITLHHSLELEYDVQVMAAAPGDPIDWLAAETSWRQRFSDIELLQPRNVSPGQILVIRTADVNAECARYFSRLGIHGSLRTCFADPAGEMRCWMDIVRGPHPGGDFCEEFFNDEVHTLLLQLLPHLTRALGLYVQLRRQEAQKSVYEASLDHLSLGCLMLNQDDQLICANMAARTIIGNYQGITLTHQRLLLSDQNAQQRLNQAIVHARTSRSEKHDPKQEHLVRIHLPCGMLLGMLVAPAPVEYHYQSKDAPSTIIYLAELRNDQKSGTEGGLNSGASVARLFGLTPQEGRLALLLASGHTLAEAAEQLGVAVSAARNYSKNIYSKLGIRGQSDLVRLINKSFALLR